MPLDKNKWHRIGVAIPNETWERVLVKARGCPWCDESTSDMAVARAVIEEWLGDVPHAARPPLEERVENHERRLDAVERQVADLTGASGPKRRGGK